MKVFLHHISQNHSYQKWNGRKPGLVHHIANESEEEADDHIGHHIPDRITSDKTDGKDRRDDDDVRDDGDTGKVFEAGEPNDEDETMGQHKGCKKSIDHLSFFGEDEGPGRNTKDDHDS